MAIDHSPKTGPYMAIRSDQDLHPDPQIGPDSSDNVLLLMARFLQRGHVANADAIDRQGLMADPIHRRSAAFSILGALEAGLSGCQREDYHALREEVIEDLVEAIPEGQDGGAGGEDSILGYELSGIDQLQALRLIRAAQLVSDAKIIGARDDLGLGV